jgi:hypothetical protein
MPDPIRKEDVNIELAWMADARTQLAIRRQADLMGFETPAGYLTRIIATTLASDDWKYGITRDGRLVHGTGAYTSDGVLQNVWTSREPPLNPPDKFSPVADDLQWNTHY